jgi:hypothetical protein
MDTHIPTDVAYRARMQSTLAAFAAAWSRCDIAALMDLVGENPIYRTSGGLVFEGREAVRRGFEQICKPSDVPPPPSPPPHFFDNMCLCHWSLTLSPGEPPVAGIDVIEFDENAKLILKDAYRKLK